MKDQFVTELATDLFYIRRPIFAKNVKGQTGKKFELWVGSGVDIPVYVLIGFQHRDGLKINHEETIAAFCRPWLLRKVIWEPKWVLKLD